MNGKTVKPKNNNNQSTFVISKKLKTENNDKSKEDNINKGNKQKKNGIANENTLGTNDIKMEVVSEIKQDIVKPDSSQLEGENTVQHEDILTSLQVMPVASKVEPHEPEPFDTSKVIAAMRVAMMNSIQQQEKGLKKKDKKKRPETDKKKVVDDANINEDLIICNGCGMQFDNASACQRHRKKCVYYKDNKIIIEKKTDEYNTCSSSFSHISVPSKHHYNDKQDATDDRKMPQLRREEPVEETHCDDVDDIPVLSPEDITKDLGDTRTENNAKNNTAVHDDEKARRLSLLEITINEVANESFDIYEYKSCKELNETFQDMCIKNEFKHTYNKINYLKGNVTGSKDTVVTQGSKEKTTVEVTVKKNSTQSNKGKEDNKTKLEKALTIKNTKTIKDSPIPKEIKKKKRSTSLALFLREVEKLEEEGVIVLGKRRRKESSQKYDIAIDCQKSKSEVKDDVSVEKKESSLVSEENKDLNFLSVEKNENEYYVNQDEDQKTECEYIQNEDITDIKKRKTRGRLNRFVPMELTNASVTKSNMEIGQEDQVNLKLIACKKVCSGTEAAGGNNPCLLLESKDCVTEIDDINENDNKSEHHNSVEHSNTMLQIAANDTCIDKESVTSNECCMKETPKKQKLKKITTKNMQHLKNGRENVLQVENNVLKTLKNKKSVKNSISMNKKQLKSTKKAKLLKQKSSLSTSVNNLVVDNVCENTDKLMVKSEQSGISNKSSTDDNVKELQKDINESATVFKSEGLKRKLGSIQGTNDDRKELQKKVKKLKLYNEIDAKINVSGKTNFEKKRVLTIKEKLGNRYKCKIRKILKKKDEDSARPCNKASVLAVESIEFDKIRKKKKIKIGSGITRNKWEVSVISVNDSEKKRLCDELEQKDIQIQCEVNNKKSEVTKFFCSCCDVNFPTAFRLYEHKLSAAHRHKETLDVESGRKIEIKEPLSRTDGNEITAKCCKSLHSVISDLEKRTLTVAKVVNKLKQRDSTDSITEDVRTNGANNVAELPLVDAPIKRETQPTENNIGDTWTAQALHNQDWNNCQEWLSRSTTPLWESNQQPWENDPTYSVSCTSSLGSILDSVNKVGTNNR